MKKIVFLGLAALLALTACTSEESNDMEAITDAATRATEAIVTEAAPLAEALGADGPWIIITTDNITAESDLVVAGEVPDNQGNVRRKLAFYAQDADRNITERYTVTAPRLIIRHANTRLQGGVLAGDVYVEAPGFNTIDATIDGNLYFADEALQESASIDEASEVTGSTGIGTL